GCAWTAASADSWIAVRSGQSGNASGTVGLTVAANAGDARVGRVNVAGQNYTVNQVGAPRPAPAPPPAPTPPPSPSPTPPPAPAPDADADTPAGARATADRGTATELQRDGHRRQRFVPVAHVHGRRQAREDRPRHEVQGHFVQRRGARREESLGRRRHGRHRRDARRHPQRGLSLRRRLSVAVCSVLLAAASAAPARAQTLADVLTFLVTNQSVPTGSVERDRVAAQAASVTISRALLANLATLPVPSTSAAFVYRLNPELGTVERKTQTFGPFFLERALTAGRGHASAGLTLQHVHFTSLDGRSLSDGSLVTTANQFADETQPFDVDRLTLDVNADVATLYGTVGVTNNLEVGVAAPMVSLTIDGSRVNTYRGKTFTQATASGHAVGFADMLLRAKYTLFTEDAAAVAAAVDVRLPTGRQSDLLGAGTMSYKISTIGSMEGRYASAHANVGLTLGGLATELSYGGGLAPPPAQPAPP